MTPLRPLEITRSRFCRVNGIVAAYETNLLEDDGVAEALVLEREGSGETVLIRLAFPGLKSRRLSWCLRRKGEAIT
jgi:hypothetical protein